MDAEKKYVDLLHKDLSYQIRGCAIEVCKNYGTGHFVPKIETDTFYNYLRNSEYELGFLINFGGEQLTIKRTVYSNDRKPWFQRKGDYQRESAFISA